ncbi:hypothetical protein ACP70R_046465 [Stipagrostis hirtigluma subsp. patula]
MLGSKVEAGQAVSDKGIDTGTPIRLDAAAQAHIEKHRKLQEDLTDEMVVLARQLKESSLMMNQSVQETDNSIIFPRCQVPSHQQLPHCRITMQTLIHFYNHKYAYPTSVKLRGTAICHILWL